MTRTLILGDWPCYNYMSQIIPLAKCFKKQGEVGLLAANPVTLHILDSLPFIDDVNCISLNPSLDNIYVSLISKDEGLKSAIDYFFLGNYFPGQCGTPPEEMKLIIKDEVYDLINSYDKIVLIYDGNFKQTKNFFEEIIARFESKCIGRIHNWISNCDAYNEDKYMPKEAVEAFGFEWTNDLIQLDLDWYKEYDPGWNIFEDRTVGLTLSAGCETYMPIDEEKTYYRATKLSKLLSKKGYKVHISNRHDDIRRQMHLRCEYHIVVDSIAVWTGKCFNVPNVFLISGEDNKLENRLGLQNILVGKKSLREVEPEEIVNSFLNKVIKI